jgi:hypothetical protein
VQNRVIRKAMQSGDDTGSVTLALVVYVWFAVVVWMVFINWLCRVY